VHPEAGGWQLHNKIVSLGEGTNCPSGTDVRAADAPGSCGTDITATPPSPSPHPTHTHHPKPTRRPTPGVHPGPLPGTGLRDVALATPAAMLLLGGGGAMLMIRHNRAGDLMLSQFSSD
jgi:hypothetical protein